MKFEQESHMCAVMAMVSFKINKWALKTKHVIHKMINLAPDPLHQRFQRQTDQYLIAVQFSTVLSQDLSVLGFFDTKHYFLCDVHHTVYIYFMEADNLDPYIQNEPVA